ncbi:ubiquinol-cytochrome c reductase complex assembly factor 1 [Oratosquilla oratoria]|uniref:ubiquinol-cytochrome c reductase complex assembly factor 1 n=1 Tax=Oratosquilla oratoria TaxID=337810 RepID=UPI003F75CEBF
MISNSSRLHSLVHAGNRQIASAMVVNQVLVPRVSQYTSILSPRVTSLPVPKPITGVRLVTTAVEEPGTIKKLLRKMGWLEHSRSRLKASGFKLYESIAEKVVPTDFFQVCEMPDTFQSWFVVIELHIWMVMVRLEVEGEDGRFTRNALIEALWEDVDTRSKKLGAASLSIRKEQINQLVQQFQASLFAYDEGILSNDKVLAGALWRRLFNMECSDPERLECCVSYVRKQIALLDSLSREDMLLKSDIPWQPLLERDFKVSWK